MTKAENQSIESLARHSAEGRDWSCDSYRSSIDGSFKIIFTSTCTHILMEEGKGETLFDEASGLDPFKTRDRNSILYRRSISLHTQETNSADKTYACNGVAL